MDFGCGERWWQAQEGELEEHISVSVDGLPTFTRVEWLSSSFSQFGKVVEVREKKE